MLKLTHIILLGILLFPPLGCKKNSPNEQSPNEPRATSLSTKNGSDLQHHDAAGNHGSQTDTEAHTQIDDAAPESGQTASPNVDSPVTATTPVADAQTAADAEISSNGNAVAYQPGITLNYEALQVEVDAQVILRQGELELLLWAESPTPKGHETILATKAKPSDIYEALGLMGLTPGSPPWFDFEKGVAHAAKGDAVEVRVRYLRDNQTTEHNICEWVSNKALQAPMKRRDWVFCGSRREENGRFAADFEGTVITVVDFPSSLLSLAESHSESNAALWLVANAKRIPDIDTPVTVILRAVALDEEKKGP